MNYKITFLNNILLTKNKKMALNRILSLIITNGNILLERV